MATQAFLQQAYLAYFGRPIDLNGVAAYANSTNAEVENAFWASPESQALYGTTMGLTQINQVYNMLFGRDAEPAGLAYWANQIIIGKLTPAGAAIGILNGAQGTDVTAVSNKLAASAAFTAGLDTTAEILGFSGNGAAAVARTFLSTITMTPATQAQVDKAIADAVAVGNVTGGSTFTLTTSATDVIVGTAGNDTIIGDWNTTGTGGGTVQASDQINGGDGNDTLKLYSYATGGSDLLPVSVKNVETFQFLAPGNKNIDVSAQNINTLAVTQADKLAGATLTTAATTGLALNTAVKAAGPITWAAGAATSGNLALNGFTGATAAAGAGDLTVGAAVATLNIQTTAGANATSIAGAGLKTVNITGGGDLNLGALAASVTKVDGSTATGSLKMAANALITTLNTGSGADNVDFSGAGAVLLSSNLGAGNDIAKFGAAGLGAIAAGSLVDGGAGSNIVNIAAGAQLVAANVAKIANFATLDVSGGVGPYDTSVGGFTTFQADHNINGAGANLALNNVASGFTFTDIGAKGVNQIDTGLTFALKADGKADVANLNVIATDGNNDGVANGNVTITTLNVTQFETLNLGGNVANPDTGVAPSKYVQTITNLTAPDLTALNFSGNEGWVVGASNASKLATLNASANTGGVSYNANADTVALSITGGSGVDTFVAGKAGTTVYAAGGNDVLTLAAGVVDIAVYKAASDVTVNTNLTFVDTAAGKIETVNGFQTTVSAAVLHDTIDLSNIGGFNGYAKGVATVTFTNANSIGASVANLFVDAGGQRGTAAYTDGADTYLFVDANHDGNFTAAADMIVKVAGVNTLTASDINFG